MEIAVNDNILPLIGDLSDSMSEKEFFDFCRQNDLWRIERDENKQIIIMPPTTVNTGKQNSNLVAELVIWNRKENSGICFDSSTGFTLPDSSVRSPDASWISIKKWEEISDAEKNQFAHVCPEFVIELKSPSENLKYLTNKMNKWIENGCSLAWLINPENKTISIYRKNGEIDIIKGFDNTLSGENVLPGFELKLSILND